LQKQVNAWNRRTRFANQWILLEPLMSNLRSSKLIVAKGMAFLAIACCAAFLILEQLPNLKVALLLAALVWASARFYYFLFYVLERYVDHRLRYSGIGNLVVTIIKGSAQQKRTNS